ncbi:DUF6494 family protein [Methylohalobius crimeensis]|uniref:DUF6494 family protein n=1 Tax=Methylohalobius crimeensis TaxID=244365 RepID=UPI0003B547CF|nr:DUF6494 family protein [Methylohalobius crimeensis]
MNDETMNMAMRKFLKKFGVSSQQQIEYALFEALEKGRLKGTETLSVKARLELPELGLVHEIDGEIPLE